MYSALIYGTYFRGHWSRRKSNLCSDPDLGGIFVHSQIQFSEGFLCKAMKSYKIPCSGARKFSITLLKSYYWEKYYSIRYCYIPTWAFHTVNLDLWKITTSSIPKSVLRILAQTQKIRVWVISNLKNIENRWRYLRSLQSDYSEILSA